MFTLNNAQLSGTGTASTSTGTVRSVPVRSVSVTVLQQLRYSLFTSFSSAGSLRTLEAVAGGVFTYSLALVGPCARSTLIANIIAGMDTLSNDEIEACRVAFNKFDKDGSGSISDWELRAMLQCAWPILPQCS